MISIDRIAVAALAVSAALSTPALAAEPEACKAVRFADVGWTDIQATTLDKRKTTRFRLGTDGKAVEAERDGQQAQWVSCDEVEKPADPGMRPVYWARPGTSLKVVRLAIHNTDVAPVAIFDENDSFLGAIGVRNVLQAVLKRHE